MLERTGARTALLITEGFRDSYEIGRINRPDAYNLFFRKHVPLVERALRFEVRERVTADRRGARAAGRGQVDAAVRPARGGEGRSRRDPAAALLCEPEARERGEAHRPAAAAARLRHRLTRALAGVPRVRALLDHGRQRLHRAARQPLRRARSRPLSRIRASRARSCWSSRPAACTSRARRRPNASACWSLGPAAGVVGAQALCRRIGARRRGRLRHGRHDRQGGRDLRRRGADRLECAGRRLQRGAADPDPDGAHLGGRHRRRQHRRGRRERRAAVGPQSAGAEPGPACYGLGGTRPR